MTVVQIAAHLTASDVDNRTLSYRILPFNEEGRTNVGKVRVTAGRVQVPATPGELVLNLEHDRTRPVGRGTAISEQPDGLYASFRIANTTAGDDLLTEAADGLRAGASVELDDIAIRGGELLAGRLTAVGAVTTPAFPNATLTAADCGDLPTKEISMTTTPEAVAPTVETPEEETVEVVAEATPETVTPAPAPSPALAAARAPMGVQKPGLTAVDRKTDVKTISQMLASIAATEGGGRTLGPRLLAALDQVTVADVLDVAAPESFEGKLWQGREYERQFTDLVTTESLDKLRYRGWKWAEDGAGGYKKPQMAAYAGFPAEPPSNEVAAEETTWEPGLIAWAGQMDRRYRDFSEPEFWTAFFTAIATSYARVTDLDVLLTGLWAGGTALELDIADLPTDVPEGVWKIVKGIREVKKYGMPSGVVLHADLWEEIMFTKQDNVLPYLNLAMGVDAGSALSFSMKPDEEVLTEGQVLVAVKQAAKFRELPGSPIRVDAEVISKGGIEQGVFGYAGLEIIEPLAIACVQDATP